jgi:hypothetical protein
MTIKHSIAKKKYWEGKTPEERSARGSFMARGRWVKMSAEQRSEYAKKIIKMRWTKNK